MKSEITKKTDTSVTLKVSIDESMLQKAHKQTIDKLRARVKAAGFRPGKAPDHIVERELGDGAVQAEVIDTAITQAYAQVVTDEKLAILAPPEVEISKFVPYTELEFTATVDVMPEIKLADYKNFKLKRPKVEVDPKEIDGTIDDLRKRLATKLKVMRAAKEGDELTIDFEGSKEGQLVDGASAQGHQIVIGSKTFIPGFEDELIGMKPDEEKTFDITFPKDYQAKELAGQKVTFKVKVHQIDEMVLPELDEKFAKEIGPFKSVEELRSDIEARIQAEKAAETERQFEDKVLEELISKSNLALPERLVAQQKARLKDDLSQRLAASGLDIDKYLGVINKSMEEIEKEMQPVAEKRVALALVLNAVGRAENISVSPEEIEAELVHLRSTHQDPAMQAELADPAILEDIHNHLLASRTIAKILSYITD